MAETIQSFEDKESEESTSSGDSGGAEDYKIHILVADDDSTTRKLISSWLSPKYKITLCKNGEAALKVLHSQNIEESVNPIDLVISDVKMPGSGGLELLKHIKRTDYLAELPVICELCFLSLS
jgi:CheY-like chemotaxis protein